MIRTRWLFGLLAVVVMVTTVFQTSRNAFGVARVTDCVDSSRSGIPRLYPLTSPLFHTVADKSYTFSFCSQSSQGPSDWVVLWLGLNIDLGPKATGFYQVGGLVNNQAATQTLIQVNQGTGVANSLGLVSGSTRVRVTHGRATIWCANYLQIASVKPGTASFKILFSAKPTGSNPHAVTLPSTTFRVVDAPYDELRMHLASPVIKVLTGDQFDVPFTLTRRGNEPDGPGTVVATYKSSDLDLLNSPDRRFTRVGQSFQGTFRFRAKRSGTTLVEVQQVGRLNQPHDEAQVFVAEDSGSRWLRYLYSSCFVLLGVIFVMLGPLRSRLRHQRA